MPPFVGVAVKVTLVPAPAHIVLVPAVIAIDTEGVSVGLTTIVIPVLVAVVGEIYQHSVSSQLTVKIGTPQTWFTHAQIPLAWAAPLPCTTKRNFLNMIICYYPTRIAVSSVNASPCAADGSS